MFNWLRKKKTAVEVDTTFMEVIEMFFVKHESLQHIHRLIRGFTDAQQIEAKKAVNVITLSQDPSRDTILLVQAVAKLDRVIAENGKLRSQVHELRNRLGWVQSDAADRLRFINTVKHAIGELK